MAEFHKIITRHHEYPANNKTRLFCAIVRSIHRAKNRNKKFESPVTGVILNAYYKQRRQLYSYTVFNMFPIFEGVQ